MGDAPRPSRLERLRDASGFGLAYGFSLGLVTLLFAFERGPKSWACIATALALGVFAAVARRIKGPRAARAVGIAFLPNLVLWLLAAGGSHWRGPVVAGTPDWVCGYHSISSYGAGLLWMLLSGIVAMGAYYWEVGRTLRSTLHVPRVGLVWLGAAVMILFTAWGTKTLLVRPSLEAFRESIGFERRIEAPSTLESGAIVFDDPTLTISMDDEDGRKPRFDLHDGFGKRSTNRLLFPGDVLSLFRDPGHRVWVVRIVGEFAEERDPLAFARFARPQSPHEHDVHVRDVRGAIGPPPDAVVAPGMGAFMLVVFGAYASWRRRATRRILVGTEGHWDGGSYVDVAGAAHRLDGASGVSSLVPGPVVASTVEVRAGYRTTPSIDGLFLVSGTRGEHAARFRSMLQEWQPLVLVLAGLLALPLLGAASLGCL